MQVEVILWTNKEMDDLLDFYLFYNHARYYFHQRFERTWDSIKSMLWKIAVRYNRAIVRNYVCQDRKIPSGKFNDREKNIIALSHSPVGIENEACEIQYLACILNRTQNEIREYLKVVLDSIKPMFPPETEKEKSAMIGQILKRFALIDME